MVSSHVSLMRWVASYQWRRGLGDYSVWWIYRAGAELKYGRCREETQKETSLTLNETVPLTVGKGTAHLIQKVFCFFWQPLTRVGKSTCNWSLESIGKWLKLYLDI
ncbi:uncharacterized protein LOC133800261 isoform X4 [Humulus lupulus]|uniref:uncharacterized protein LOC133800261 isoform X4 n=1 Tax=Humulus lupulus TaxID=3486 RepID=UPI002B4052C0|nr:uncharacterized protein LOC133800261 isoform X4 [Humulus lupulus]